MSFISNAQNFEDVMIWRALKHVTNGFYIDVGAAWPDIHSVTKSFYDAGWSGINIEPNKFFFDLYPIQRSNDINLQLAIGDKSGFFNLNVLGNSGLSSLDQTITDRHVANGHIAEILSVEVQTLSFICGQYAANREIHFLKIDVEGFEQQVLLGNDWRIYRPWVIVIEATIPMQQVENYEIWEPILINADYLFAYADGLNRFYVSKEHRELLESFKYPPNVFDSFKLPAEVKLSNLSAEMSELTQHYDLLLKQQHVLLQEQHALLNSTSWRITQPLRLAMKFVLECKTNRCYTMKYFLKKLFILIKYKLNQFPKFKSFILLLISCVPRLRNRFVKIDQRQFALITIPIELRDLTSEARSIHGKLQRGKQKKIEGISS